MGKVLLIKAEENKDIVGLIEHGAVAALESMSVLFDTIVVPRAIEIPSAISFAIDSSDYEGVVCIGCVKEEAGSDMDKIIYSEVLRAINEFAVHYAIPIGIGIGLYGKKHLVSEKAPDLGNKAANSVVNMIKLKRHFTVLEEDRYSVGQKHN
jgi:6,7-dimethyl-8-ribityllumazine synthase